MSTEPRWHPVYVLAAVVLIALLALLVGTGVPTPATDQSELSAPGGSVDTDGVVGATAPATFQLFGFEAADTVPEGEEVTVAVAVENAGEQSGETTVEYRVDTDGDDSLADEAAVDAREVTLGEGETRGVGFSLDAGALAPGTYLHGVVTPDDTVAGLLTVDAHDRLLVADLTAPERAVRGETIVVGANVTAEGDETVTRTVEYRIDRNRDGVLDPSERVANRSVRLAPGERTHTGFEVTVPADIAPAAYHHGVVTDDGAVNGTLTVVTPDGGEPTTYQLDLVTGEPIEVLDPSAGRTYHREGRYVTSTFVSTADLDFPEEPHNTHRTAGCVVGYSGFTYDAGTGVAELVVNASGGDGCESVTLSFVGYALPEGVTGWVPDRAHEQVLADAHTVTLVPGEERRLVVDVDG